MAKDKSKPKKETLRKKAGSEHTEEGGGKKEKVSTRAEPTKKMACTCRNAFQDTTYGQGVRVFNRAGKGPGSRLYRCTACKREVTV